MDFINAVDEFNISANIKLLDVVATPEYSGDVIRNCKVIYHTGWSFEGTARRYDDFDVARRYLTKLKRVNTNYKARDRCILRSERETFVVVDRLYPLNDLVTSPEFWKRDNMGTVVGCGPDLIGALRQVLEALEAIHNAGYKHGRLLQGISFDSRNNVKLHNFQDMHGNRLTGQDIVDDLEQVGKFCKAMVDQYNQHHLHHQVSRLPEDAKLIIKKIFKLENYEFLRNGFAFNKVRVIANFLYRLPICWYLEGVGLIFKLIHSLGRDISSPAYLIYQSIKTSNHYANWQTEILTSNNVPLLQVYFYKQGRSPTYVPPHNLLAITPPANKAYNDPEGISDFVRNTMQHKGISRTDGVRIVMEQFPGIGFKFYLEMLRSKGMEFTIIPVARVRMIFHEYAGQFLMLGHDRWRDGRGLTRNTPCTLF